MLLDGALERIAYARGCILQKDTVNKAQYIHHAVRIIGELKGSLDLAKGGKIAANLDALYEYMIRKLLMASMHNRLDDLEEVTRLLGEIRGAWVAIPLEARSARAAT
jgi:flagellar protein FliS